MQSYKFFPTADVGLSTFSANLSAFSAYFVLIGVIKGSDPLMIQRAGNSVFLAGFRWVNAGVLSGPRGSYQRDTWEIPGRNQRDIRETERSPMPRRRGTSRLYHQGSLSMDTKMAVVPRGDGVYFLHFGIIC